jgi:hypothetical protein
MKSRRLKWAEHVARMGDGRGKVHTGFWWGNLKEELHLENPGTDRRIILKRTFEKWDERNRLNPSGSGQEQAAGSCECGNEHSGSIKCEEFLD